MKSIPPILLSISYIVLFLDCSLRRSEKLLKISKVSYAWKTYRKHFSRSLDFVEIIVTILFSATTILSAVFQPIK
ncbi:hypothetical protein HMPREF1534_01133 [Phocaeicola massiliensis B84634 = Timone 84634 = DSM 17679 = JCM 13223]|uniref:Uncharacterized protein n=1 Tax=Phocaeicola massiliensis B84634 = Timone 84634 = DSM 17679 = JCM 13223 TaxID=1121098 RepID=U6RJ52_9BACT|nr:hypothetical protein [Phocaeicola massiliensis]EOA56520.1 hypothetical protein HMPREF1534_01133 [Phocaeicola massiliensis B84634 = Timone 84634 = DSM 17679 = JCM 13223]